MEENLQQGKGKVLCQAYSRVEDNGQGHIFANTLGWLQNVLIL